MDISSPLGTEELFPPPATELQTPDKRQSPPSADMGLEKSSIEEPIKDSLTHELIPLPAVTSDLETEIDQRLTIQTHVVSQLPQRPQSIFLVQVMTHLQHIQQCLPTQANKVC